MANLSDLLGVNNVFNRGNSGYDPLRDGAKMSEGDMWRISDPRGISPDYYTAKSIPDMIVTDLLRALIWNRIPGLSGAGDVIEKKPRNPDAAIRQNALGAMLGSGQ